MLIAVLLAAGLAWWLHQRGELVPNLARFAIGGAFVFGAVRLLETGQLLGAAALVAGAALWWKFGQRRGPAAPQPSDLAAARGLLGVAPDADAETIRAAHRKLIAEVHPDHGGSSDLAARVTAARDTLLAAVAKR